MTKLSKKSNPTKYDAKRAFIVKELALKFDCTPENVRKAIKKTSVTEQSVLIEKEYQLQYKKLTEALS